MHGSVRLLGTVRLLVLLPYMKAEVNKKKQGASTTYKRKTCSKISTRDIQGEYFTLRHRNISRNTYYMKKGGNFKMRVS